MCMRSLLKTLLRHNPLMDHPSDTHLIEEETEPESLSFQCLVRSRAEVSPKLSDSRPLELLPTWWFSDFSEQSEHLRSLFQTLIPKPLSYPSHLQQLIP